MHFILSWRLFDVYCIHAMSAKSSDPVHALLLKQGMGDTFYTLQHFELLVQIHWSLILTMLVCWHFVPLFASVRYNSCTNYQFLNYDLEADVNVFSPLGCSKKMIWISHKCSILKQWVISRFRSHKGKSINQQCWFMCVLEL